MNKKLNGFNNGRDRTDGVGGKPHDYGFDRVKKKKKITIPNGNNLIAERIFKWKGEPFNAFYHKGIKVDAELQFHSSWQWLLPAVWKILPKHGALLISKGNPKDGGAFICSGYKDASMQEPLFHAHANTDIRATWIAITEYLKNKK